MAETGGKRMASNEALGVKIDILTDTVNTAIGDMKKNQEAVVSNQIAIGGIIKMVENNKDDIDSLEAKVNGWSVINSLGVVFAGIVGWFSK